MVKCFRIMQMHDEFQYLMLSSGMVVLNTCSVFIMPWCACAAKAYGSLLVFLSVILSFCLLQYIAGHLSSYKW